MVRSNGFTLVELLTVLAIIGVLATLLATTLSTAQKKARQTACTSNLRQISLALHMYLEDQEKRPTNLSVLMSSKYLPATGALRCPEDKIGNWGGLVESQGLNSSTGPIVRGPTFVKTPEPLEDLRSVVPCSYLHPLPWENWAWDTLMKADPSAGIAVCQLHGLGKQNPAYPNIRDFEGLILRAQRDGTVVRRQVFWQRPPAPEATRETSTSPTAGGAPPMMIAPVADAVLAEPSVAYPWQLFTDAPIP